jgi:DNA-directed RNA polymerase specialized sigma24 family protein
MPEQPTLPEPPADPRLRQLIADCLGKISARPLAALRARMRRQGLASDRAIARDLGVSLNAFLQNIVRARKQLAECLERHAVPLEEILR